MRTFKEVASALEASSCAISTLAVVYPSTEEGHSLLFNSRQLHLSIVDAEHLDDYHSDVELAR